MKWNGHEWIEPVPSWSCSPVSTRREPRSATHIQRRNWVHTGIVRILDVCSIYIFWRCSFKLHAGRPALFSHLERCFLTWASRQKAKAKAIALRTELVKKRKVNEEINAETWMQSKKRREMNAWRDHSSHEVDVSKELDADFNFPNIRLMPRWVEQIRRYGALQQYSAERHEQAHKTNLKDGWNASNHNLNYLPQVITFQRRVLCFEIRELNLQAHAQRRENSTAAWKVPPSAGDLAAPPMLPVICEARIHVTPKLPRCKASWRYDHRLPSITRQYTRHDAPHGNTQRHAGVYQP